MKQNNEATPSGEAVDRSRSGGIKLPVQAKFSKSARINGLCHEFCHGKTVRKALFPDGERLL